MLFLPLLGLSQKTWVGSSDSNWNNGANWSPAGAPANGAEIVIGAATHPPTLNGNRTITNGGSITINAGGQLTITGSISIQGNGQLLVVGGELLHTGTSFSFPFNNNTSVSITAGLLTTSATNFKVNSRMEMSGGDFVAHAGLQVQSGKTFAATAGNIRVTGTLDIQSSNANFYAGSDSIIINGRINLSAGTQFYGGTATILVNRSLGQNNQFSGNFSVQQATIVFNPSNPSGSNLTSISSSGAQFNTGQGTVTFNDSVFVGNNAFLNVDSGTVTFLKSVEVFSSGTINNTTGTLNFNGSATFKSSGFLNAGAGNLNFGGDVIVDNSNGVINADQSHVVIQGNITNTGTFDPGTSTVTLAGDSSQTISNDIIFYNLEVATQGSLVALGNVTVLNDGVIGDSTDIDLGNNQFNVQGDLTDNGGNLSVATVKPFVVNAGASGTNSILIEFNEALNSSATNAGNYSINPSLTITNASLNGRFVTLTVANTIANAVEYVITMNDIQNLAEVPVNANHIKRFTFVQTQVPTTSASNVRIFSPRIDSLTVVFTPGNGSQRLVVARADDNAFAAPANATTYAANAFFGQGAGLGNGNYVVYNGTGASFVLRGLLPKTQYFVRVYEYNGGSAAEQYGSAGANQTAGRYTLPNAFDPAATAVAIGPTGLTWSWQAEAGTGLLLLARKDQPVVFEPTDSTNFTANAVFGQGDEPSNGLFVLYQGDGTSVEVTALEQNSNYHFAWYSYVGDGTARSYRPLPVETQRQHTYLRLGAKLFLEGPYASLGDSMHTWLANFLPAAQPYNTEPWNYSGSETIEAPRVAVVDWLYLQLRKSSSAAAATRDSVVYETACLLMSDGSIQHTNGDSAFVAAISAAGPQYLVLYHRTHIPVMSSVPIAFNGSSMFADLTEAEGAAHGTQALVGLGNGKWGLYAGRVENETTPFLVDEPDRDAVWTDRNRTDTYRFTDAALAGVVDASDRTLVWNNRDRQSQVP